jgi:hypothetical protein
VSLVLRQLDSVCTGFVCCYSPFDCRLTSACVWQSVLNGKRTNRELQTVLSDVNKAKSMALLLRTIVAADVQSQLAPSPSGQERYVLRLLLQCTVVLIGQIRMFSCSMPFVAMQCCAYWTNQNVQLQHAICSRRCMHFAGCTICLSDIADKFNS